jgi:hypothetical protein
MNVQQSPLLAANVNADPNGLHLNADALGSNVADGSVSFGLLSAGSNGLINADTNGLQINADALGTDVADGAVSFGLFSAGSHGLVNADTGGLQINADALGTDVADASVNLGAVNGLLGDVVSSGPLGSATPTGGQGPDSCGCDDAQQAALISADVDANQGGVQIDAGAAGVNVADISVDGIDTGGVLVNDILHG